MASVWFKTIFIGVDTWATNDAKILFMVTCYNEQQKGICLHMKGMIF
jgi:hypothetical protein